MNAKVLTTENPYKLVGETKVGPEDYEFCVNNTTTAFIRTTANKDCQELVKPAAELFMHVMTELLPLDKLKQANTLGEVVQFIRKAIEEFDVPTGLISNDNKKAFNALGFGDAELAYNAAILANLIGNMYTDDRLYDFAGQMRLMIAGAFGTSPESTPILGALWFDIMVLSTGAKIGYLNTHYHNVPGEKVSYSIVVADGNLQTISAAICELPTMPPKSIEYSHSKNQWSVTFSRHKEFCERQRGLAEQQAQSVNEEIAAKGISDEEAKEQLQQMRSLIEQIETEAQQEQLKRQAEFDANDTEDLVSGEVQQSLALDKIQDKDQQATAKALLDGLLQEQTIKAGNTTIVSTAKVDIA